MGALRRPVVLYPPRVVLPARPHPVLVPRGRGLSGLGAVAQILPGSVVSTIAGTIQSVEGYYPGSVAYINNNPGNLIYAGQAGATQGPGGFAVFDSYDDGLAALDNQIQLYASRGLTISQMTAIYAPAGQGSNDPTSYANDIAGALGVSPDTALTDLSGSTAISDGDGSSAPVDILASIDSLDPVTLSMIALVVGVAAYEIFS